MELELENYLESIKDVKYPYEDDSEPDPEKLFNDCGLARHNLWIAQNKFDFFPEFFIYINNIGFSLSEDNIASDPPRILTPRLCADLDPRLLRRILDKKAHWNNAEIGCHIEFEREPDIYNPDTHLLMSFFHL